MTTPSHPRLPDWQPRLQALIQARLAAPFAWGEHDCCLFVCDAVQAITGHDPAADLRGYRSEREAMRIIHAHGGLRAIAQARAGAEVPVLAAQVGDVGLLPIEGRDTLALCGGAHWLAPGAQGLVALPLDAASNAWRAA
jgi:hypothetical protein